MMTKIHGKHTVECDACGDTLETDTADFAEALRIMRSADWQARKIGQDWVHTCFGCKDEGERHRSGHKGDNLL